jgi:iron(III) transport system substrate-binding protein
MLRTATAIGLALTLAAPAAAEELNIYSARHYDSDILLFDAFTEATGIEYNLIEGSGDELLARITQEGANSPADVFITVDGGRLHRAVEAGIFSPVESEVLESRVPEKFQHPDNLWFGISTRARVIYYNKERGRPEGLNDYEDLADPAWEGEICIRTSSNIYNVSLMAEIVDVAGEEAAQAWAEGLSRNLARAPQGGDTDQIRAVAAGECWIGVGNTYYWGRLMASGNPEDRAAAEAVGIIFPNQDNRGTHVNLSGAGVVKTAPNRENAIRFLEFLVTPEAQQAFADGNNEYPVVDGVEIMGPIADYTDFKRSDVNASIYGTNAALATQVYDRAGMP